MAHKWLSHPDGSNSYSTVDGKKLWIINKLSQVKKRLALHTLGVQRLGFN
jgi:hypothetical protein